jgi:DNA-binding CsgD family transcriptional regulator
MQAPFADPLLGLERLHTSLPLVGRDRELHAISGLLDTVAFDLPTGARALTISGEMGVGKTRLLAQMCLEARARGFLMLEANAYESGSTFPYFPIIEALRPLIRTTPTAQLGSYVGCDISGGRDKSVLTGIDASGEISWTGSALVTALARLFPELPALLQVTLVAEILTPEQEKFRLLDAIATLLERIAAEQPILLGLDSLQWADSASLELLFYLIVRLRTSRVALVGVTRPPRTPKAQADVRTSKAAMRALGNLMQQGMLLLLPLGSLDADAAAQHLSALLPGILPETIAQPLLARAEGNPFFLEELVRTLTLNRHLVLHNGVWNPVGIRFIASALPESIALAVEERLQGLSHECLALLRVVALFGRTFPADALAYVLKRTEDEVQPLLDEAVQASVIAIAQHTAEDGILPVSTSYIFCQGIVQEALQAALPAHQARSLHCAIGKALEVCYAGDAFRHAAELARHYALGGEKEATLHWSLVAGEDAVRQQAHREAIHHFRVALKLVEETSSAELHFKIGDLLVRLGELEQGADAFQQALTHLQQTVQPPAPLVLARINRSLADVYRIQAKYDQSLSYLQAAQNALDQATDTDAVSTQTMRTFWFPGRGFSVDNTSTSMQRVSVTERIFLLQGQAMLHIFLNRPREAEAALWQSHQLAIEIGDRGSQAFALHFAGWIRGWGEHIHEALRLLERAHDLYIELGDPFRAALGDYLLGIIYQTLGDMKQAHLHTLRGLERVRRYGVRGVLGWLHGSHAMLAITQGDWASGESYLQQALQEATTSTDARLKALTLLGQAELQFRRGNWQEAEHIFHDAISAATNTEWFAGTISLYGHFLAVTGRGTLARPQLDRAAACPEPPGLAGSFYIPFLAEGYLHLEAHERACTYIERIRRLRGFLYCGFSVDRILGEVAALSGDWQTAERAFEEGLLLCQRANNAPEEATILYEQARTSVMRGGDLSRVYELCERARTLFREYSMQRAVDMVDTLQEGIRQLRQQERTASGRERVGHEDGRDKSGPYGEQLTRRELEVLRLVAEGHTDREVADILVISPRTANRHLSNIFVKLDVPGRAAAVAYAIRNGLV